MTIDTVAPQMPQYLSFNTSPSQALRAIFEEPVTIIGPIGFTHMATNQTYQFAPTTELPGNTPTFEPVPLAANPSGRLDRDGMYRVTGVLGACTDLAGNALNTTQSWFDFGYLRADFNGDFNVDFTDLVTLAQNYGRTSGVVHAQGDVNYDGGVDFADLVILAQSYNVTLLTGRAATLGSGADLTRHRVADILLSSVVEL